MTFDFHIGTSKFDVRIYNGTQCQKEYGAEVHFHYFSFLCNPFVRVALPCAIQRKISYLCNALVLFNRPGEQIIVPRCLI
jgi:hypothetical protein